MSGLRYPSCSPTVRLSMASSSGFPSFRYFTTPTLANRTRPWNVIPKRSRCTGYIVPTRPVNQGHFCEWDMYITSASSSAANPKELCGLPLLTPSVRGPSSPVRDPSPQTVLQANASMRDLFNGVTGRRGSLHSPAGFLLSPPRGKPPRWVKEHKHERTRRASGSTAVPRPPHSTKGKPQQEG